MDYSSSGGGGGGDKAQSASSSATSGQMFGGINTGGDGGLSGPIVLGAVAVFVLGLVGLVWAISRS